MAARSRPGVRSPAARRSGASASRAAAGSRASRAFERQLPDARRLELIEATIECLKRFGHEGLSIRRIAAQAGVSIGLINHHFPHKNELVAQAYVHFNSRIFEKLRAAVEQAPPEAGKRLSAFLHASFAPPNLDQDVLAVWVVFWGMHRHSREIQRVHEQTYGGYLALVHELLEAVHEQGERFPLGLRLSAIGLTALLDGLWLEWCLNPRTFAPDEAIALCDSWIRRGR
jgi:TetR/AcrR family transcriptional regulator, transcriptional repressor of bet genes